MRGFINADNANHKKKIGVVRSVRVRMYKRLVNALPSTPPNLIKKQLHVVFFTDRRRQNITLGRVICIWDIWALLKIYNSN